MGEEFLNYKVMKDTLNIPSDHMCNAIQLGILSMQKKNTNADKGRGFLNK